MQTKKNTSRHFYPAVRWASTLYGLAVGLMIYTAPNYFFGPANGIFLTMFCKQTSLASNDLDSITIHYSRCAGVDILTRCLAYLLLSEKECSSAMTRILVVYLVASVVDFARSAFVGSDEVFYKNSLMFTAVVHFLLAVYNIYYLNFLKKYDTAKVTSRPTMIQRIANFVTGVFAVTACIGSIFGGASHYFHPKAQFDEVMMEAAKTFGFSLVSAVFATFIEGNNTPQLVSKMECLYGILMLPVLFKAAHDNSGYFNQEAFTGLAISSALLLILQFRAAGAFGGTEMPKKHVTNKEA